MRNRWRAAVHNILSDDRLVPILIAAVLAVLVILILWALSPWYEGQPGEILRGIYIEATGAAMDIVVFGFVLALLVYWTNRRRERALEIARHKELIDDFKKWDADEARYRIAGALRRLNRLGCTKIDFSGIELSDFSFGWHEIESIEGSTFYDGSWGTLSRKDNVALERVDFSDLDCRNVVFSKFNPFSRLGLRLRFATFKDCNFRDARMQSAVFRGAHLEWTQRPPDEMGEWVEIEDGNSAFHQTYWPPFDGVDLSGVSFQDVCFTNADFRDALNVQGCSFSGAEGLAECLFDNDEIKKRAQEAAKSGNR
ncbi:MAG: pentapeptide repeat-containing protein [Rhodospirillaceae bacterium]|nr:pentapeptide repeat-containing protein [Rhodospirillaceae bacterium]MDE0256743.1 pentapeptide repeat-containing protein [Rhodospirillaceae bacterium]MDE0617976.1 pentapeptide repeat-containing protein [Rhodospirillaceae bacterium]